MYILCNVLLQELLDSDTLLEEEDLTKPDPASLRSQSFTTLSISSVIHNTLYLQSYTTLSLYSLCVCIIIIQVNVALLVVGRELVKTGKKCVHSPSSQPYCVCVCVCYYSTCGFSEELEKGKADTQQRNITSSCGSVCSIKLTCKFNS